MWVLKFRFDVYFCTFLTKFNPLSQSQRFYSLDVFRGATVCLMILVNNPGSWSHIYGPLSHAPWHGCTPTDLVFPFFLFAVGNAMAFVMPRLQSAGPSVFWQKVLKRTFLIFIIGFLLNWFPFIKWEGDQLVGKPFETLRFLGVLQRIALCYGLASIIVFYTKSKGAFYVSTLILLLYWGLCLAFGNPADPFSLEGFFGTPIDRALLGEKHLYKGEGVPFDPEGLVSTLPAISQVIFGYLVGEYIQKKGKNYEMTTQLFVAGGVMIVAALGWDLLFPLNKKLWTSSYVLYTSGLAMQIIATMIYLIEFKQATGAWSKFFDAFGKNPLFIFVLSGMVPKLLWLIRIPNGVNNAGMPKYLNPLSWFYEHICKPISDNPKNGSLLYALIMITFYWLIAWWMDKKKIYVKV
jgi:predicted acyltransferase